MRKDEEIYTSFANICPERSYVMMLLTYRFINVHNADDCQIVDTYVTRIYNSRHYVEECNKNIQVCHLALFSGN